MLEQIERLFEIKSELGICVGKGAIFCFSSILRLERVYVCGVPGWWWP